MQAQTVSGSCDAVVDNSERTPCSISLRNAGSLPSLAQRWTRDHSIASIPTMNWRGKFRAPFVDITYLLTFELNDQVIDGGDNESRNVAGQKSVTKSDDAAEERHPVARKEIGKQREMRPDHCAALEDQKIRRDKYAEAKDDSQHQTENVGVQPQHCAFEDQLSFIHWLKRSAWILFARILQCCSHRTRRYLCAAELEVALRLA